jgi:hypothetical protein
MAAAVSLGASVTRPLTTFHRSFAGAISDRRSGLLLSSVSRSLGSGQQRVGTGCHALELIEHPQEKPYDGAIERTR